MTLPDIDKRLTLFRYYLQYRVANYERQPFYIMTMIFNEGWFPPELIVDLIKAGSPVGGVVLDIFHGAGTTGLVSRKLQRNYIACDLSKTYIDDIANPRLIKELGLFI